MTSLPSLTKSAPLSDWRGDKKLTEMRARQAQAIERSTALAERIADASADLVTAAERDRQAAGERLLGRDAPASTSAVAAQATLDQLMTEQRQLKEGLPAFDVALEILTREAEAASARDVQRAYRTTAKRLAVALDAASVMAAELKAIHHLAEATFLGDHVVPVVAGLPSLAWPEIRRDAPDNPSHLDRFHAELAELGW